MQSVLYQEPFDKGKLEGKKEGKLEGKLEGRKEGKLEVAKKALREGMEIDLIAKLTGLSEKEIKELAKETR
ncbi:MAG: hypothetical protein GX996_02580 [Firmicutes bacterium]|nr:hypothetical protein [Bacillota bacterium]